MADFDYLPAVDQLVTVIKSMTGFEDDPDGTPFVRLGVPESASATQGVFVGYGGQAPSDRATQLAGVAFYVVIDYAYALEGDEQPAERALFAFAAALTSAMRLPINRTLTTSGGVQTADSARLMDTGIPGFEYQMTAGEETRVSRFVVEISTTTTF
jgi:hypothetical protein